MNFSLINYNPMDNLTKKQRKLCMSHIRSKDTKPEKIVRRILTLLGWRYRLHNTKFPGKPDIVISKAKTIIFIHGCFWHHHKGCSKANFPKSNKKYWIPKIKNNISRDKKNIELLKKEGWRLIIIWECEMQNTKLIIEKQLGVNR